VWYIGTREDGQAQIFFSHTDPVSGKKFLLKMGRYVDMKREALLTRRLQVVPTMHDA
jgi:hypothetical protein